MLPIPESPPSQHCRVPQTMPENHAPIALPEQDLSDGSVTLRPWRLDDVPAVVAICDDPLSAAYTTVPAPYSETDAHDWLATHHVNLASGDGADFAVTDAADGDVLGSIGVRVHAPGMAEVGYITAPGSR